MNRVAPLLSVIWASVLLAGALWLYLLIFRMPIHVEALSNEGRHVPLVTQHTIDIVGGEQGVTLLTCWAIAATAALLFGRAGASEAAFSRRKRFVSFGYFIPVVVVSLILALPEFQ